MKKSAKLKILCAVLSVFLLVGLCACNNTNRNAKSFSCFGGRGDAITFDIKTQLCLVLPGPMSFKSNINNFDEMFAEMQRVSPRYDYVRYAISGKQYGYIHNNSQTAPCSYLFFGIYDEKFNFHLMPETAHADFTADEIAFPYHFMTTQVDANLKIKLDSVFLLSCNIEQLADFYNKNGYETIINETEFLVIDHVKPSNIEITPSIHSKRITIEFNQINENYATIEFKSYYEY